MYDLRVWWAHAEMRNCDVDDCLTPCITPMQQMRSCCAKCNVLRHLGFVSSRVFHPLTLLFSRSARASVLCNTEYSKSDHGACEYPVRLCAVLTSYPLLVRYMGLPYVETRVHGTDPVPISSGIEKWSIVLRTAEYSGRVGFVQNLWEFTS